MYEFFNDLLEMPLFIGLIFLLFGIILYFFPPKKVNIIYGYKTPKSMNSQESWNFAQNYSSIKMIQSGIFSIGIYFFLKLFNFDDSVKTSIGFILLFTCVFYIIFFTERILRIKFPNN